MHFTLDQLTHHVASQALTNCYKKIRLDHVTFTVDQLTHHVATQPFQQVTHAFYT